MVRTRLCLIAPADPPADCAGVLKATLAAGDVASLLFAPKDRAEVKAIADIAASHGVAVIALGGEADPALDGLHIETGAKDVAAARRALGQDRIVGVGGINSRHDAMVLGELLPDYVFFGHLDGDDEPSIHASALDLAAWWAALFEIPAMVMGGSEIASIVPAQEAGIEFVALRNAVWDHPAGAAAAVAEANALLDAKVTA